jgi:hypothetical protein
MSSFAMSLCTKNLLRGGAKTQSADAFRKVFFARVRMFS